MEEWKPYMGAKDIFCPLCNHSVGIRVSKTTSFSYCKVVCAHCGCEFTIYHFKEIKNGKEMGCLPAGSNRDH